MRKLLEKSSKNIIIVSLVILLLEIIPSVGPVNYSPLLLLLSIVLFSNYRDISYKSVILCSSALVILCIVIYRYSGALSAFIAEKTSGNYLLFSAINSFYESVITLDYGELFYHSAYSRAVLTNGGIISGAKEIFKAVSSDITSRFLSGKYISTLFLPFGLLALKSDKKTMLSLIALSFLAGDNRLLLAYILLYSPSMFVIYIGVTVLGYLACAMLDIRIGFTASAGIIEFIKYAEKPIFFVLISAVCTLIILFSALFTEGKLFNKEEGQ
jgi:hypothetical protein